MAKRRRIVVRSVDVRLAEKKREAARQLSLEKRVSMSRAYAMLEMNLKLGLLAKGVSI